MIAFTTLMWGSLGGVLFVLYSGYFFFLTIPYTQRGILTSRDFKSFNLKKIFRTLFRKGKLKDQFTDAKVVYHTDPNGKEVFEEFVFYNKYDEETISHETIHALSMLDQINFSVPENEPTLTYAISYVFMGRINFMNSLFIPKLWEEKATLHSKLRAPLGGKNLLVQIWEDIEMMLDIDLLYGSQVDPNGIEIIRRKFESYSKTFKDESDQLRNNGMLDENEAFLPNLLEAIIWGQSALLFKEKMGTLGVLVILKNFSKLLKTKKNHELEEIIEQSISEVSLIFERYVEKIGPFPRDIQKKIVALVFDGFLSKADLLINTYTASHLEILQIQEKAA